MKFLKKIFLIFFLTATFSLNSFYTHDTWIKSNSLKSLDMTEAEFNDYFYVQSPIDGNYNTAEWIYFAINSAITSTILRCVTNPLYGAICVTYVIPNIIAAIDAKNKVKMCTPSNVTDPARMNFVRPPLPLSFEETRSLMKETGISDLRIPNVVQYMTKKVCLDFDGEKMWMESGNYKTKFINNLIPSTVSLTVSTESPKLLCARVSNLAPIFINIQNGIMRDPKLEKDDDGGVKIDPQTGQAKLNDPEYIERLGKHCRMLPTVNKINFARANNTMIDDSCFDLRGHSKRSKPFTAVVAECIQGTMLNLFTKPYKIQDTRKLNQDDVATMNDMYYDYDQVKTLYEDLSLEYSSSTSTQISYSEITSKVNLIQNNIKRSSLYSSNGNFSFRNNFESSSKNDIKSQMDYINKLKDVILLNISQLENKISTETQGETVTLTFFDTIKGNLSIIGIMIIVIYIISFGLGLIKGSKDLDINTIKQTVVTLFIVIYFAIGDGWKEYAINASFRISQGFLSLFINENNILSSVCNFSSKKIYVDKDQECDMYTGRGSTGFAPNNEGVGLYTCPMGEFMPSPQYERPFVPVVYKDFEEATVNGKKSYSYVNKILDVYCDDGSLAVLDTGETFNSEEGYTTGTLKCPLGISMETGYRGTSLFKAGYVNAETIDPDASESDYSKIKANFNDVLSTAYQVKNKFGVISDVEYSSIFQDYQDKIKKQMIKNIIEDKRIFENATRTYPVVVRNGIKIDYSFLSIFDSIDCRLGSMLSLITDDSCYFKTDCGFRMNTLPLGDILVIISFFFTINLPILLTVLISMFFFIYIYFFIGLRIVMSFLHAIISITFLALVSPIIIPMSLLKDLGSLGKQLYGTYDKWASSFKNAMLSTIVTSTSSIVFLYVSDYMLLGDKQDIYTNLINPLNNFVKSGCMNFSHFSLIDAGRLTSWIPFAPISCSMNTLSEILSNSPNYYIPILNMIAGPIMTIVNGGAEALFAIVVSSIVGVLVLKGTEKVMDAIEDIMKSITSLDSGFEKGAVNRAKNDIKNFAKKGLKMGASATKFFGRNAIKAMRNMNAGNVSKVGNTSQKNSAVKDNNSDYEEKKKQLEEQKEALEKEKDEQSKRLDEKIKERKSNRNKQIMEKEKDEQNKRLDQKIKDRRGNRNKQIMEKEKDEQNKRLDQKIKDTKVNVTNRPTNKDNKTKRVEIEDKDDQDDSENE